MKYKFFCTNFTEVFPEVDLGPSGTTYAQMSQNCRKIVQIGLLGTQISRDWDRNRKTTRSKFSPFLQISRFQNAFRFDLISYGVFKKASLLRPSILPFDIK